MNLKDYLPSEYSAIRPDKGVRLFFLTIILCAVPFPLYAFPGANPSQSNGSRKAYLDQQLPVEKRVDDLLGRMTLQEKVGQMCQVNADTTDAEQLARNGLVGSFLNFTSPEEIDRLQTAAVKESRLGIPILFGLDVIHGFSTIFPIPLAEASTWDPDLVKTCASVAAKEAFSQGIRWTFSPMVDIARDPRWGRIAEGAGEDPYLGMAMARAQVEGYQGPRLTPESNLVACAKHFVAYGAAEGGRDYNTAEVSERTLREIYLPPFEAAVDAGAGTIMSAFDDLDGVPATANPFTLREILKGEWAFKGFVVSDWDAVGELINHGIACDSAGATLKAVTAGVDMDMVGPYHTQLVKLVKDGKVPIEVVNDAVRRILTIKFELGLFDHPYVDVANSKTSLMLPESRKIAREEARESIVLLKNDGNVLPLSKDVKSIAVIGPLADSKGDMLGPWHCMGKTDPVVTLLAGIKAKLPPSTKITYAEGCGVNDTSTAGFAGALKAAEEADVVILAVGERGNMSGEAESRSSLNLPGVQEQLAKELVALGKPVVEVLMNGRPLSVEWSADHVPAILETWFLGTETGNAISDVLFGDYNPSGKLPVTFPRTVGQVPIYYNHMNTGRPASADHFTSKYIDLPSTPLFSFGFGLSYTQFAFSDLNVVADPGVKDQFFVTVDITNTGKRSGAEI
ncbi:MAG TPA: glycoside hydrolase family 3 N-terminal domain-containing protein, partial [Candidatus Kryptobacter bacterium]|nr:glycoside hydrolase family 3 N-terminal domain-containing protein [Candidatus Kryptobacter bacterium]